MLFFLGFASLLITWWAMWIVRTRVGVRWVMVVGLAVPLVTLVCGVLAQRDTGVPRERFGDDESAYMTAELAGADAGVDWLFLPTIGVVAGALVMSFVSFTRPPTRYRR